MGAMANIGRRDLLKLGGGAGLALSVPGLTGAADALPIIDVHLHAYPAAMPLPAGATNPITGAKGPVRTGAQHLAACIAEMQRHNVVKGVVSGGDGDRLQAAIDWRNRDPQRFVAGAGIRGSADTPLPPLDVLRKLFADGTIKVLGEVTAEYAGLSLSDPLYDPYLALAEEYDVPVALHIGTMPPGTPFDPCCTTARARLGHPETIEEALSKHPKLRVNLMHSGWPYIEETIAMLMLYPNVNVDTGANAWLLPRAEFHGCLKRIVGAGFGKRVMFGSDNMFWPEAIGLAIEGVASAPFLSAEQKRDIFYNNAAAFYRL
jgi:predicted TIM-barrel fold metal-dependent hydrolase